ncbi:MAG TPA: acyl-CoA synthetase [Acidimicrobiales bacterium]|jgi:long-chain acyl-CoA synthetase|nr:acyl-CoA synthetase [Acidimicrobiales bacterium]
MAELGFFRQAAADPDRVALVAPDGTEVTAGQLAARANQISNGLRALGLERGDTLAVVVPNGVEMMELVLGAQQIGLYLTPINHHLVGPEIAYIVSDSDAKVLVGHERFAGALTVAADEANFPEDRRFAIGTIPGWRSFSELTDGQPATRPEQRTAGAPMHYTSGTTGRPKGVKRALVDIDPDEMGALYSMFLMMFGVQAEDGNVHITGSPLYHTAVLLWTTNSLHLGHKVVLMDKWSPEEMLRLIDKQRVTTSHMVPTQFHRLLALPEDVRAKYDVSSLRCMVHAAAPCPIEIKRRMIDWWGDSIMEYYAATEGGGTIVTAKEWLERPGTVGKAWAGSELRILDDDGNQLPTGEIGTVYMALAQATFEYKGDPEKTNANRRDGFFTVGDVGELDEDGYLFLRDRKIDMIISGGVNIYPAEIEGTFLTCPLVGDVAIFGIPNEDWGEEIKAVIEPAEGQEAGPALEAQLRDFAETNLASYKRPKSYDFTSEMPRDPSGKLYKRKLRDPYWDGIQRLI